jgi:hypothetical protein
LSYFTVPLHRRWSIIISFLVSSCAVHLFSRIFPVVCFFLFFVYQNVFLLST